jgi:hypothetical protein
LHTVPGAFGKTDLTQGREASGDGKPGFADLDGQSAEILAIGSQQVERAEHGGGVMATGPQQLDTASPLLLLTMASPSRLCAML